MLEKIVRLLGDYTDVPSEEIKPESDFVVDLHIDSVDMVALVMAVEDEFGVSVPDSALSDLRTVGDVMRYLEK